MVVVNSFSRLFFISCVTHRNFIEAFFASGIPTVSPQLMQNRLSSSAVATTKPTDDDDSCNEKLDDNVPFSFRILCLHGKGGNGEEFLERLLSLRTLLDNRLADEKKRGDVASNVSIKWEALTAPYQISDTDTYAWWTMSPGVRSFNADEYIGFDESASKVMDAVFPSNASSAVAEECIYDLILGHSQGAILLSALLATNINLQRSNCGSFILNGAAWPNPYDEALTSLSAQNTQHRIMKDTRMLFIMGKSDTINPIESAKQVHDCYKAAGLDVSIVYHEGGHSVPNGKDLDSERAMRDVCDFILRSVREKADRVDTKV
jgi:predicted esterase